MKYVLSVIIFSAFISCSCLKFEASRSIASTNHIERSDIFDVQARNHDLGELWERYKMAQVEAVTLFVEAYKGREIVFLARDAEYLFDTAKLLYQDDPETLSRLKMINISRANMHDPNLKNYLNQEGIDENSLREGKKFVFIDSGFHGTIVDAIQGKFPTEFRDQLHGHFLASENFKYPSTRVFLQYLGESAEEVARTDPAKFQAEILKYEKHLPHFAERSNRFEQIDGKWVAVSATTDQYDGLVSSEDASKYMEDIKYYIENEVDWAAVRLRRKVYSGILDVNKEVLGERERAIRREYRAAEEEIDDKFVLECMHRDILELEERDAFIPMSPRRAYDANGNFEGIRSTFSEVNRRLFSYPPVSSSNTISFRVETLKEIYPKKWYPLFDNPLDHISSLLRKGKIERVEMYATRLLEDGMDWPGFWRVINQAYADSNLEETLDSFFRINEMTRQKNVDDRYQFKTLDTDSFEILYERGSFIDKPELVKQYLDKLITENRKDVLFNFFIYIMKTQENDDVKTLLRSFLENYQREDKELFRHFVLQIVEMDDIYEISLEEDEIGLWKNYNNSNLNYYQEELLGYLTLDLKDLEEDQLFLEVKRKKNIFRDLKIDQEQWDELSKKIEEKFKIPAKNLNYAFIINYVINEKNQNKIDTFFETYHSDLAGSQFEKLKEIYREFKLTGASSFAEFYESKLRPTYASTNCLQSLQRLVE